MNNTKEKLRVSKILLLANGRRVNSHFKALLLHSLNPAFELATRNQSKMDTQRPVCNNDKKFSKFIANSKS